MIGCSETGGEVWTREAGLAALELGDEAVVDVADFSLEGRAMRNVRQMVNRVGACRLHLRVRRVRGAHRSAERDGSASAADDWRGTGTERGFSMALGRLGDPATATASSRPRTGRRTRSAARVRRRGTAT